MIAAGWLDAADSPSDSTFKTPEHGAATAAWAATSLQLADFGGLYCEDAKWLCVPKRPTNHSSASGPMRPIPRKLNGSGGIQPNLLLPLIFPLTRTPNDEAQIAMRKRRHSALMIDRQ